MNALESASQYSIVTLIYSIHHYTCIMVIYICNTYLLHIYISPTHIYICIHISPSYIYIYIYRYLLHIYIHIYIYIPYTYLGLNFLAASENFLQPDLRMVEHWGHAISAKLFLKTHFPHRSNICCPRD